MNPDTQTNPTTLPDTVVLPRPENINLNIDKNHKIIDAMDEKYPHAFKVLPSDNRVLYLDRPEEVPVREINLDIRGGGSMNVDTVFISPDQGIYVSSRRFLKLPEQGPVSLDAYGTYIDVLKSGSIGRNNSIEEGLKDFGPKGFEALKQLFQEVEDANKNKPAKESSKFEITF